MHYKVMERVKQSAVQRNVLLTKRQAERIVKKLREMHPDSVFFVAPHDGTEKIMYRADPYFPDDEF
jgi:hypothetical protein